MSGITTTARNLSRMVGYSSGITYEKLDQVAERENVALGALAPIGEREESPENIAFGLYATLIGSMCSAAPEMTARSSGGRMEKVKAAAMAAATTQIAKGARIERGLEVNVWDFFYKPFCSGFVEMAPAQMSDLTDAERSYHTGSLRKGGGSSSKTKGPRGNAEPAPDTPSHWPKFKALMPYECGWDQAVRTFAERRFSYHVVIEERDELLDRATDPDNEDGWIGGSISNAPRWKRGDISGPGGYHHAHLSEEDDYIRYYVIYVPGGKIKGEKPGPNQPGTIHTVSAESVSERGAPTEGEDLREPYYFTGHPDGPHIFGGQYTTGHDAMFLPLFGAVEDSLSNVESVSEALFERIREGKVVTAHDLMLEEEIQRLAKAQHLSLIHI